MYSLENVKRFLDIETLDDETRAAIMNRAEIEVAKSGLDGKWFSSAALEGILGSEVLKEKFSTAWEMRQLD